MFSLALQNTLLQLLIFVGVVYLVGYLVYVCNKIFYGQLGNSRAVCLTTGIIGTPIHELSHALLCIVFGHRITEIKLFQIDDESGTLGYVNHSYNPKNWYQRIGNYFIGVAPLFGGSLFLYLIMSYFVPNAYFAMNGFIAEIMDIYAGELGLSLFPTIIRGAFAMLPIIFFDEFGVNTVIFIVITFCVALHMNLSTADIRGSIAPLPILAIVLFLVNFVLSLFGMEVYASFLQGVFFVASYLLVFLALSLILSLIILVIGFILKLIRRR